MNLEIRENSVVLSGYVNAVERYSKPITYPLHGKMSRFVERIKAGAFAKALKKNDDVKVLLNHEKEVATTKDGSCKLSEDNIGLKAEVVITDNEVVEKARQGKLNGWSFGMHVNDDTIGTENGMESRTVNDLDLDHIAILDDRKNPAYYGTSVEARAENEIEIREVDMEENQTKETVQEEQKKEPNFDELIDKIVNKLVDKLTELNVIQEQKSEQEKTDDEPQEEPQEETQDESKEEPNDKLVDEKDKEEIDYSDYEDRLKNL